MKKKSHAVIDRKLDPLVYEAVRSAINLARNEQIQSVDRLRKRMRDLGYLDSVITEALAQWKLRLNVNDLH